MTNGLGWVGKNMVIQAKNSTGSVGNTAVLQAISAKAFYGCDEAMVVTNSYCWTISTRS